MARAKNMPRLAAKDGNFGNRLDFSLPPERMAEIYSEPDRKEVRSEERVNPAGVQKTASPPLSEGTLNTDQQPLTNDRAKSSAVAKPVQQRTRRVSGTLQKKDRAPKSDLGSEKKTAIRMVFGIPLEITDRAAVWAEKAKCPTNIIIKRLFADIRPELVAQLEGGADTTNLDNDSAAVSPLRFNTTLTISSEAQQRLSAQLDPEGIIGLGPALTKWVRSQTLPRLSAALSDKGY